MSDVASEFSAELDVGLDAGVLAVFAGAHVAMPPHPWTGRVAVVKEGIGNGGSWGMAVEEFAVVAVAALWGVGEEEIFSECIS